VPAPVIGVAIEPATADDVERLRGALDRLAAEDPSFVVGVDPDTGATTIAGMGELHLEVLVDRLRREFGVDARVGRLQVAYRETVTGRGQAEARHLAIGRTPADYGHVILAVAAADRGRGVRFANQAPAAEIPADLVPAVAEAVVEAAAGRGGRRLPDDRSRRRALGRLDPRGRRDRRAASSWPPPGPSARPPPPPAPTILEPLMELEVRTPDDHTGDVLGELLARRAKIGALEARGGGQVISATVPLAEMMGYASVLRSSARAGAAPTRCASPSYAEVPQATRARLATRAAG
jgi:elongation factor G